MNVSESLLQRRTDGGALVAGNRIRRYERLWTEPATGSLSLPAGFVLYALEQLNPAQRAAASAQRGLYQWAYDRARAAADERFIHDWII
jgi:hypothetical protein